MMNEKRPRHNARTTWAGLIVLAFGVQLLSMNALAQDAENGSKRLLSKVHANWTTNLKASFSCTPRYPIAGQAVQFTDASAGGPTSWSWDFGDGSTSTVQNPQHSYAAPGFRRITLTVINASGSKRASRTIAVMPETTAATFVFSPSTPGPGQTVQFADTTSGEPTSWRWDFGDGSTSTAKNPSHVYMAAASYTVSITANCSSGSRYGSRTLTVASITLLSASFSFAPSSPVPGQAVQFTDVSTGNPTSWLWNFGDGSTSTAQNPSHIFAAAGSRTVTLTVSNATGSNTTTRTLTVLEGPAASFSFSPNSPTVGQTVQFTDTSTGTPTSRQWNFGDGSTSTAQNPSHAFATAGSRTVTLTVANASGSSTTTRTVPVVVSLNAAFTFSPISPTAGQAVHFTDTSTGSPSLWQWNFGDGSTSTAQNPSHSFVTAGNYTISLTVMNSSGQDEISQVITVAPASVLSAAFIFSPTSLVAGQTVQFTDTSTGSPSEWAWDFGEGTTSAAQNPRYAFMSEGSYSVRLTVVNGSGSDSTNRTVRVGQSSTILPPDRTIDWSGAGVWYNAANPSRPWEGTKGIPDFPVGITVSTTPGGAYYCDPTGATDCRANLQAAINACPEGRAVYLPAGTYLVSPTISMRSYVVLRGAGPGVTTIIPTASSGTAVTFRMAGSDSGNIAAADVGPDAANSYGPLSSGYTKGSYTVVVQHATVAANLAAGQTVLINQLNDPDFVTATGYGGTCTWAAGNGNRAMGEVKMIASVNGTSMTFTEPLWYSYEGEFQPKITRCNAPIAFMNSGIENMTIDGDTDGGHGGGYILRILYAAHCWMRGVEIKDWNSMAVRLDACAYGCEITNNYFHDVTAFGGSSGYGVAFTLNTSYNYVYDNIFKWVHVGVALGSGGGTANVVAYNYCHSTNHWQFTWAIPSWGSHGAHTYMNLEEGNIGTRHLADGYWGSGSHLTLFRNWSSLYTNNPDITNNIIAVEVEENNQYTSVIGNVLGHAGIAGGYEIGVNGVVDRHNGEFFIWKVGFGGAQDGERDARVINSLIRHGNYDYINNAVADWIGGASRDLPPSLYLDAKPSWFGFLDWPAIGPDVPGYTRTIPAKSRWDSYVSSGRLSDLFSN
jgi:PKD repeat protein